MNDEYLEGLLHALAMRVIDFYASSASGGRSDATSAPNNASLLAEGQSPDTCGADCDSAAFCAEGPAPAPGWAPRQAAQIRDQLGRCASPFERSKRPLGSSKSSLGREVPCSAPQRFNQHMS